MKSDPFMEPPQKIEYGSFKSYLSGFIASIILTLAAYFLVIERFFTGLTLDISVMALALLQAFVQLILFLNLTREPKPRWNGIIFLFTIMVVLLIVIGSLWIMYHLNYNLMIE